MASDSPVEIISVPTDAASVGRRLDVFLSNHLPDFTRSYIKRRIDAGDVSRVSGDLSHADSPIPRGKKIKASIKVRAGETWRVVIPPEDAIEAIAEDIPLAVLYEDADIVVINKPAGMTVHPAFGHTTGTLVNALLGRYGDTLPYSDSTTLRPGIVHRLDRETSGVIVCAKTSSALKQLQRQFHDRLTRKLYLAIARHAPTPPDGEIDAAIGRSPGNFTRMTIRYDGEGKPAQTRYHTLAESHAGALIEARPLTGRTHQIRLHLKSRGATLYCDALYGTRASDVRRLESEGYAYPPRHMLHARSLKIIHPASGEPMAFIAPVPDDMRALWNIIRADRTVSLDELIETRRLDDAMPDM